MPFSLVPSDGVLRQFDLAALLGLPHLNVRFLVHNFARARCLLDDVRSGIVGYLSVLKGEVGGKPKLSMGSTKHPSLDRAYSVLKDAWVQVRGLGRWDVV